MQLACKITIENAMQQRANDEFAKRIGTLIAIFFLIKCANVFEFCIQKVEQEQKTYNTE